MQRDGSLVHRFGERSVDRLPVLSASVRAEIARRPLEPDLHAELLAEYGFLDTIEVAPPPAPAESRPQARVVAWNLERCRYVTDSAGLLSDAGADVALLSELDQGMARTGQRHTARELATRLGFGYAFAIEFIELGLGDEHECREHRGEQNEVGYHGGAILSRQPLRRPALLRLDRDGAWFDGTRGERRIGGRIAILATLALADVDVTWVAVHLESHSDPRHRALQMKTLLAAIEDYAPAAPAVIGGDLNTLSLPTAELGEPERLRDALHRAPGRFLDPIRHEPLFSLAAASGFEWRAFNRLDQGTLRARSDEGSARRDVKLDWLLVRGLAAESVDVIEALDPSGRRALSDHEAIAATLRMPG